MGRGGARGGGRGGRGGKRGGGDAASSGEVENGATIAKRLRGGKKAAAAAAKVGPTTDMVSASGRRSLGHNDMYDEVDDFMDNRHKISLNRDDDDAEEGESDAEDPMQQGHGTAFELEGLEPEEEDEDEEAAGANPDYDEVEAQEEEMARKRDLAQEAAISKGWGRKKSAYHGADTVDFEVDSDEEKALDEEKEGIRLQREQMEQVEGEVDELDDMLAMVAAQEESQKEAKDAASGKKKKVKADSSDAELLKAMDDDLDGIQMALDMDMEMDLGDEPAAPTSKGKKSKKESQQSVMVEKIAKDVSALSDSAKMEVLLTSSPELLSLLDDLKSHMSQLQTLLPVWEELKANPPNDRNRTWYCFLALKVESLLMYCCHVSFYLSMKASGDKHTQSHPIMKTLLQLKKQLNQLEPMEAHFAERGTGEEDEDDEEDDDGGEEGDSLDADEDADLDAADEEDGLDEGDMDGMDDEDDDEDGELPPMDPSNLAQSDLMSRQGAQLERLLADVGADAKKAKKSAKKQLASSSTSSAAAAKKILSDFGEVDHRAEMARNITLGKGTGKLAVLQASAARQQAENVKALEKSKKRRQPDSDEEEAAGPKGAKGPQEKKQKLAVGDAAYEQLKTKRERAKAAKKALYTVTRTDDPSTWLPALGDDDHRKVTKMIDSNRGLVRSRDKQRKTPKTRNRARWDKKKIARNGQVQEFKGSQAANYGGQATGIKTTVTKSISLK